MKKEMEQNQERSLLAKCRRLARFQKQEFLWIMIIYVLLSILLLAIQHNLPVLPIMPAVTPLAMMFICIFLGMFLPAKIIRKTEINLMKKIVNFYANTNINLTFLLQYNCETWKAFKGLNDEIIELYITQTNNTTCLKVVRLCGEEQQEIRSSIEVKEESMLVKYVSFRSTMLL